MRTYDCTRRHELLHISRTNENQIQSWLQQMIGAYGEDFQVGDTYLRYAHAKSDVCMMQDVHLGSRSGPRRV